MHQSLRRTRHQFRSPLLAFSVFMFASAATSAVGCGEEDAETTEIPCDDSKLPMVLAHGFLASGDTYAAHAQRFSSNGYCDDRIYTFDWNTLAQGADNAALLDAFIGDVLSRHGVTQVDLAGHSAGGGLGYEYLSDPARAARVAHYVHLGSFAQDAPAGPDGSVPTLNIYSEGDTAVTESTDIPGATNVKLTTEDHYGLATSEASFTAMFSFLNNGAVPEATTILPEKKISVSGKAISLGENIPQTGATVEIFAVDAESGMRLNSEADAQFIVAADGAWGPFEAKAKTHYEFVVIGLAETDRVVHYFREPFVRSNSWVYLRTLPAPTTLAGGLLAGIPWDGASSVFVSFTSSTGIVVGRDSLKFNGAEISRAGIADPEDTTIAIFYYDANANGASDDTAIGLFSGFPFLEGLDIALASDGTSSSSFDFNGRVLNVPNLPASEGAVIAIFD